MKKYLILFAYSKKCLYLCSDNQKNHYAMTHFMGFSLPAGGRVIKQAQSIKTGKEHTHVRVTITRPMRRDIRPLPAGEPVNWGAIVV